MTNKYYKLNFYKNYIEVEINHLPNNNFNRNKLYYDLTLYFELKNITIRYTNKIFDNQKELKLFFKSYTKNI